MGSLRLVTALATLTVVLAACGSSAAGPSSGGPVSVTGAGHGLRLTLTVPRATYPRKAIVDATVRVQNISGHLITAAGTSCSQMEPWVEDTGPAGKVLFPDGVPWLNLIPCNGPTTEDSFLGPHFDARYQGRWVVALGPILRAMMIIRGSSAPVTSPPLRMRLTAYRPPRVIIRTKPVVSAVVAPGFSAHSSLIYLSLDQCERGTAPYDYLGIYWSATAIRRLQPECARPFSWRAIAGWTGHSAAFIDYERRG